MLSGRSASGSSVNAALRGKPCQGACQWHETMVSEQLTGCQVMAEASACWNVMGKVLQRLVYNGKILPSKSAQKRVIGRAACSRSPTGCSKAEMQEVSVHTLLW